MIELHRQMGRKSAQALCVITSAALVMVLGGCSGRSLQMVMNNREPARRFEIAVVPVITDPRLEVVNVGLRKPGKSNTSSGDVAGAALNACILGPLAIVALVIAAPFYVTGRAIKESRPSLKPHPGVLRDFMEPQFVQHAGDKGSGKGMVEQQALPGRSETFQEQLANKVAEAIFSKTHHSARQIAAYRPPAQEPALVALNMGDPTKTEQVSKGPRYADLRGASDFVLEVRVPRIGIIFDRETLDESSFLDIEIRVIKPGDRWAALTKKRRYLMPGSLYSWTKDDWSWELTTAASSLGEEIAEGIMLNSDWISGADASDRRYCFLRPFIAVGDGSMGTQAVNMARVAGAGEGRTLTWETFPRLREGKAVNASSDINVSDVTYDVRVWRRTSDGRAGDLIYERTGISGEPGNQDMSYEESFINPVDGSEKITRKVIDVETVSHHVEAELGPDETYVWSVRARYRSRGQDRLTPWSRVRLPERYGDECDPNIVAPALFYGDEY